MSDQKKYFHELPKPIAIIGLGITGESISALLLHCGIPRADLILFDSKNPKCDYQGPEKMIQECRPKTLVVSPGVPLSSPWIEIEKRKGTLITSELTLATKILTDEKIIAISGSIGKSTTTCLIGEGLTAYQPATFVGGNLGIPLAKYALEKLTLQRNAAQWLVLELSSYKLVNNENIND
jgi:UDP-N-acetylmuramoylalanine--D-glutamate ligase